MKHEISLSGRSLALLIACTWLLSPAGGQKGSPQPSGVQRDVVFSQYSDLSGNREVVRRTRSPLTNVEVASVSAAPVRRAQAIHLSDERFIVYIPRRHPSQGYGVLVFVPPWEDARLPLGWASVLDETGVIFVCASKSGNAQSILERRIPLALLATINITQQYAVDIERVYVGGFSGGARIAMRIALGYPDVFRGVLLNAGSDPIGNSQALLPPDNLFARFQLSSRIVYLTGLDDTENLNQALGSRASMTEWCVFGTESEIVNHLGHDVATASALRLALAMLDKRPAADLGKLSACRERKATALRAELDKVRYRLERNKPQEAWKLLETIDTRYAGMAWQDILDLEHQIGARR